MRIARGSWIVVHGWWRMWQAERSHVERGKGEGGKPVWQGGRGKGEAKTLIAFLLPLIQLAAFPLPSSLFPLASSRLPLPAYLSFAYRLPLLRADFNAIRTDLIYQWVIKIKVFRPERTWFDPIIKF